MILEIVRDVIDNTNSSDGYLESAKILIISHDISFIPKLILRWGVGVRYRGFL